MKFEETEVFNFGGALRGMRNPMNSWDKGDSGYVPTDNDPLNFRTVVGSRVDIMNFDEEMANKQMLYVIFGVKI